MHDSVEISRTIGERSAVVEAQQPSTTAADGWHRQAPCAELATTDSVAFLLIRLPFLVPASATDPRLPELDVQPAPRVSTDAGTSRKHEEGVPARDSPADRMLLPHFPQPDTSRTYS